MPLSYEVNDITASLHPSRRLTLEITGINIQNFSYERSWITKIINNWEGQGSKGCSNSSAYDAWRKWRKFDLSVCTPYSIKLATRQHFRQRCFNFFFYFHVYRFFIQLIPIGNEILRRFHSCHFMAKKHSLGVAGVFL